VKYSFSGTPAHSSPPFRHRSPVPGRLYTPPRRLLDQLAAYTEDAPGIINLVAPAGYGKTSLAAACAAECFERCVWLGLQEEDREAEVLRQSLAFSLAYAGETAPAERALPERFAALGRVCVVLDNVHFLSDKASSLVLDLFTSLAEGSMLVLCSDENHCLPLSRLRMEERVMELRSDDLAARPDEALQFFQRLGTPIEEERLHLLIRKTGGWWACLRLFGLTWQRTPDSEKAAFLENFRGTDRFIAEFLTETIDVRLSAASRDILRSISVCISISRDLASTLVRQHSPGLSGDFQDLFTDIETRYLLTATGHGWYRMQPLLRQFYSAGLEREIRLMLHTAAAEWYGKAGMARQAERHRRLSGEKLSPPAPSPLHKREKEILGLAARGYSNSQIGEELFISTGTVKWHMNRILEKLDCRNRTAAVELARRQGFLP
jgi:LuxR family transcriptional regulator, maltose regulon positive regulatory protein